MMPLATSICDMIERVPLCSSVCLGRPRTRSYKATTVRRATAGSFE
jgi:hypothetical protein